MSHNRSLCTYRSFSLHSIKFFLLDLVFSLFFHLVLDLSFLYWNYFCALFSIWFSTIIKGIDDNNLRLYS